MTDLNELNLWHAQQLVGYLWRNDLDRIGFRYDKDWLTTQLQFPVSLQLPLHENEYSPDAGVAHRFFANLLPENGAPTSHILKFQISGFRHVPGFETVLTKLAQSLALPAVDIELRTLDGLPAENPDDSFMVIKHYDRYQDEAGQVQR